MAHTNVFGSIAGASQKHASACVAAIASAQDVASPAIQDHVVAGGRWRQGVDGLLAIVGCARAAPARGCRHLPRPETVAKQRKIFLLVRAQVLHARHADAEGLGDVFHAIGDDGRGPEQRSECRARPSPNALAPGRRIRLRAGRELFGRLQHSAQQLKWCSRQLSVRQPIRGRQLRRRLDKPEQPMEAVQPSAVSDCEVLVRLL